MSDNGNAASFGVGLMIGAAIGFAVGILYAPSSGSETRTMIKEKAVEAESKAKEVLGEATSRAKRIIDDAKGKPAEVQVEDLE